MSVAVSRDILIITTVLAVTVTLFKSQPRITYHYAMTYPSIQKPSSYIKELHAVSKIRAQPNIPVQPAAFKYPQGFCAKLGSKQEEKGKLIYWFKLPRAYENSYICSNHKSASTTIGNMVMTLHGLEPTSYHEDFTRHSLYAHPIDTREERRSKAFIIVREPLVRLLSGYRDRIERPGYNWQKHVIARAIQYLDPGRRQRFDKHKISTEKLSWEEFATFTAEADCPPSENHWGLQTERCNPCRFRDHEVMHLEDPKWQLYIYSKLNVTPPTTEKVSHVTKGGKTDREKLRFYYGQLSNATIQKLYQCFKQDYDLLQYSFKDFLAMLHA